MREYYLLSLIYNIAGAGWFRINDIKVLIADNDTRVTPYSAYKQVMSLRKRQVVQRVSFGRYMITPSGHEILNRIEPGRLKAFKHGK